MNLNTRKPSNENTSLRRMLDQVLVRLRKLEVNVSGLMPVPAPSTYISPLGDSYFQPDGVSLYLQP